MQIIVKLKATFLTNCLCDSYLLYGHLNAIFDSYTIILYYYYYKQGKVTADHMISLDKWFSSAVSSKRQDRYETVQPPIEIELDKVVRKKYVFDLFSCLREIEFSLFLLESWESGAPLQLAGQNSHSN